MVDFVHDVVLPLLFGLIAFIFIVFLAAAVTHSSSPTSTEKQAIICHINGNISYINRENNTIIYEKASNESCVTFPDKDFDQFLKAQFGKQGVPAL